MKLYHHKKIEEKWRRAWLKQELYKAADNDTRKKFYHLVMFAYPSGDLHIGHWYNFAPADVVARKKRMEGYNVLSPFGFDAFGLPAENAAIKRKLHPKDWTYDNIARMRGQLQSMGPAYDWSREIITSDPEYYKWTQWMFLQLYKKGLAYRAEVPANWCPSCKTVLANEQVVNGVCERCKTQVVQKHITQWLFKITAYADELLKDLETLDWPERTKTMQRNWIGRSEGAEIKFQISHTEYPIKVFTTRPDTVFGATYLVLAPEHALVGELLGNSANHQHAQITNGEEVKKYIQETAKKTEIERTSTEREKTGVELQGVKAINPATKKEVPVWISDYVLAHYGTGAIMAVPAHDQRDWEFAKKFNLLIAWVVSGVSPDMDDVDLKAWRELIGEHAYAGNGWMVDSGKFSGMESEQALPAIIDWMALEGWGEKTVTYRLHDWIVSRQRYWGAPIPLVFCEHCAESTKTQTAQNTNITTRDGKRVAIIPISENELPVLLPEIDDYAPPGDGRSPLARSKKFVQVKCQRCGADAERETDTMDTFVDSSWYFLRYADPQNKKEFASPEAIKKWLPVDLYIGGAEHATMHLLYARFFVKALADMGHVPFREPFSTMRHQGIILGEDGEKMSKSRGNVVDPDALVDAYGADTMRLYLCFMSEYDKGGPWNPGGINGVHRFLNRIWKFCNQNPESLFKNQEPDKKLEKVLHKTIKKVGDDIEQLKFNTAISALMILFREMENAQSVSQDCAEAFLKLLAPFAPFVTEEIWQEALAHTESIHGASWPTFTAALVVDEMVSLAVQINGKTRGSIEMQTDATEQETIEKIARDERLKKYLEGKIMGRTVFVRNRLLNIVLRDS